VKAKARPKKLKELRELEAHKRHFENKGERRCFAGLVCTFRESIYTSEPSSY
jgi:hypothetical protein